MAGMSLVSAIIGATTAGVGGINSHVNLQGQAQASEQNATIATDNATAIRTTKNADIDKILTEGKQKISNQFVSQLVAGAGGAGTTGEKNLIKSGLNVAKDIATTDYNYETKALDYLNQAKMYRYESKVAKANASSALILGGLNAFNSVADVYTAPKYLRKTKLFEGEK